jgi:uncharacterized membrane protein
MGWTKDDEATLLETETLELIRTQGIFLVAGIALFSYTDRGKVFAIISLIISLAINTLLLGNYYMERQRVARLHQAPRRFIDIIVVIMLFVFFLNLWIIYEVWKTEPPASLIKLAEDIEQRIDIANQKQIEENRKIVQDLTNLGATKSPTQKSVAPAHVLNLEALNRNKNTVNNAALASVA